MALGVQNRPQSLHHGISAATSAAAMSPSYGDPNAQETTVSTGTSPASRHTSPTTATDWSTPMRTLRWLYSSEADTVTVSSSTAAARASSAPRTLGTRA